MNPRIPAPRVPLTPNAPLTPAQMRLRAASGRAPANGTQAQQPAVAGEPE